MANLVISDPNGELKAKVRLIVAHLTEEAKASGMSAMKARNVDVVRAALDLYIEVHKVSEGKKKVQKV